MTDTCAGCAKLEDASVLQVQLLTGQTVCSWCPDWREECRARYVEAAAVLDMIDKPTRVAFLTQREAEFGAEYRRRLEAEVLATFHRRKAAKAALVADADDQS